MTIPAHDERSPREPEGARRQEPIAIVGMGGVFPGSLDVRAFFRNVVRGVDLVTDVPATHWRLEDYFDADAQKADRTYCRRGAFLPEVPFDTLANGIPPSLLASTDTSQLIGLLVARTTLEDAFDGKLETSDRSRVSVLLGVTSGQELFGQMAARLAWPNWEAGMRAAGIDEETVKSASARISATFATWTEATFPGLLGNVVAGRIANRLDTGGTNAVTDAACASSFAALSMALDELTLGRADVVLTGGVDTLNDIFMYMCFSKTPA
ncbi:3-oxoacyl-ACP reductase, partial [bacterium]